MSKIVEATMNERKNVKSIRPIRLPKLRWVFATIFSEELRVPEIALLSEAALVQDRHLSEEDAARVDLQPE